MGVALFSIHLFHHFNRIFHFINHPALGIFLLGFSMKETIQRAWGSRMAYGEPHVIQESHAASGCRQASLEQERQQHRMSQEAQQLAGVPAT